MARVQFTQFHRGNNYTWIVLRRCFLFNLNLIARRTSRRRRFPLDVVTTFVASGLGYITYFLFPLHSKTKILRAWRKLAWKKYLVKLKAIFKIFLTLIAFYLLRLVLSSTVLQKS